MRILNRMVTGAVLLTALTRAAFAGHYADASFASGTDGPRIAQVPVGAEEQPSPPAARRATLTLAPLGTISICAYARLAFGLLL